ncbi:cupin domain-containing protein [Bacillus haikouensis]|nr:cupin domain-containing protein [Bacillus haikouensis]
MVKRDVLSSEGSMMLVKVELAEGFVGDIDQHPEEQLSFIERGQVEFEVDGEKKILKVGDTQYIPSNVQHRVKVIEECVILDMFTPIRKDLLEG